jgi:hypothetical protein
VFLLNLIQGDLLNNQAEAGFVYVAFPKASIGQKINGNKISPTVNPAFFPNALEIAL